MSILRVKKYYSPLPLNAFPINAFKNIIFILKSTQGNGFKILSSEKMLQRLPVALTEVQTDNTSENLLYEIRQIVYSLYQAKETTKKLCFSIMILIKV